MSVLEAEVQAQRELSKALGAYIGNWVAVKGHEVIADAPTLHELLAAITDKDVDGVFQVVEESGAASFF
jgi:hypothetical protein